MFRFKILEIVRLCLLSNVVGTELGPHLACSEFTKILRQYVYIQMLLLLVILMIKEEFKICFETYTI